MGKSVKTHRRKITCIYACVCVCVSHLTSGASVLKILSHTQQTMEVNEFVGFSQKSLRC